MYHRCEAVNRQLRSNASTNCTVDARAAGALVYVHAVDPVTHEARVAFTGEAAVGVDPNSVE